VEERVVEVSSEDEFSRELDSAGNKLVVLEVSAGGPPCMSGWHFGAP
jgi:hypothetical protein